MYNKRIFRGHFYRFFTTLLPERSGLAKFSLCAFSGQPRMRRGMHASYMKASQPRQILTVILGRTRTVFQRCERRDLSGSEFGISASNATNSSDRSPLIGGSSSPIPRARTDYRAELSFS